MDGSFLRPDPTALMRLPAERWRLFSMSCLLNANIRRQVVLAVAVTAICMATTPARTSFSSGRPSAASKSIPTVSSPIRRSAN